MSSTSQTFSHDRFLAIDRFVIERQLGEGSMGAVYLALDRDRDARVALKTLRRVDASGIYRFKREFRALADVSHPNLVVLHELFAEGTDWFFTMEYVEGKRLLQYLLGDDAPEPAAELVAGGTRELSLPGKKRKHTGIAALFPTPLEDFDELRAIMQQITEAVMAVHAAGKLHRDLKPDNVMVTDNGRAVVLDFGIAIETSRDQKHGTLEAGVMGTPAYMSPEQAAGGEIDESSDWYALGAMLFEAMTGHVPFAGSYLEVMRAKQEQDPPSPSELVSGIPAELDALCLRLLSRDPSARPRGEEVLLALRGRPSSAPRKDSRPSKPTSEEPGAIFIGRAAEQKELERALAATDDGVPIVCFVQGPPGMGKTTFLERFLTKVREENRAVVLQGRCYERETMPFKAWDSVVDALCRYLGRLPLYAAAELMPKDIEALANIFPVLKRIEIVNRVKRRAKLTADPRDLRRRAFGALREMFSRIAQREPLVVCIDDLQWGDVESARLISDLITGAERPAMLFLCAYRSGDVEASPCLRALFDHTRENRQTEIKQVNINALSEDETLQLARTLIGDESPDVAAVARESRGNPYLLGELVHHLKTGVHSGARMLRGQISLEDALAERLSRLSQGAFGVLELVAVAGRPVHEEILAAVTPSDVDLHAALTELRGGKLVRGVGSARARAIELNHDGIRDAVLARMDAPLVKQWHHRLADALEAHGTADLLGLTMHLIGAEDYSRAGIYAIRAAVQANRSFAFEQAAELYAIALRYHEDAAWRQELMVQWGDALVNARAGTQAAKVYLEAAELSSGADAVELRRKAGVQLLLSGRFEEGVAALRDTLRAMGVQMPKTATAAIETSMKLRERLTKRGLAFQPRKEAEIHASALSKLDHLWQINVALQLSHPLLAQPLVTRHLLEALQIGEPRRIVNSLSCYFTNIDLFASALEGQKAGTLQLAEQLWREHPEPYGRAWIALAQGFSHLHVGLYKPALLQMTQAEELFRNHPGSTAEVRTCRQLSAWLASQLGFESLAQTEQWMHEAEERDDGIGKVRLRLLTVLPLLVRDDSAKAEVRIREAGGEGELDPFDVTSLLAVPARQMLYAYRYEPDACRALLPEIAKLFQSPLCAVRVWRGQAHLAYARAALMACDNDEDPEALLEAAEKHVQDLEDSNLPHHADHARLLRAACAFQRGLGDTARALLDEILKDDEQAADGQVVLAAARLCKARLCADAAESALLIEEAKRVMQSHGIENPIAFARLYAPGFENAAQPKTH